MGAGVEWGVAIEHPQIFPVWILVKFEKNSHYEFFFFFFFKVSLYFCLWLFLAFFAGWKIFPFCCVLLWGVEAKSTPCKRISHVLHKPRVWIKLLMKIILSKSLKKNYFFQRSICILRFDLFLRKFEIYY